VQVEAVELGGEGATRPPLEAPIVIVGALVTSTIETRERTATAASP
jgi:hypothetical protein